MKESLIWRVGNGQDMKILSDPWLVDDGAVLQLVTSRNAFQESVNLSTLRLENGTLILFGQISLIEICDAYCPFH